ncbi:Bacterial alpha-L-rhamnosidase [Tessaracoccus rhinocerotis]|uniref:alpha-L-rhamnosidase n=1 Tax=Tessaracoccus rhinocerotis TaxID=1689449 RepID=A0A553K6G1_9ACTN|nr:family 78 glycoside hydrolase catalytic domain [Tessaracoccus rhinocerotis]TRY20289.1 Bacterial alpha-L-rhamnosidase [Tessaracoccus rhinocerotis]
MSTVVTPPRLEHGDSQAGNVASARPRLSWRTTTDQDGWHQLAAEISLTGPDGHGQVVAVDGDASVLVDWPFEDLNPRQRGEVRVRVRDDAGWSDWSAATSFTAAFLGEGEWAAEFIGLPEPQHQGHPFLARLEFEVRDGLSRATWYATAHGTYQASFNGTDVDDQILKPGWTPYEFRLVHETTDVTSLLSPGKNAVALSVTGGWYTENFGFQGHAGPVYGEQPTVAGQLLLEYADGSTEWLVTGGHWRVTGESPWVAAGIYLGEDYDARLEQPGWDRAGFDDSGWGDAQLGSAGVLPGARTSPEVRVTQLLEVAEVLTSPSGKLVLDFGQNLVGRLRIRVSGEAGSTVTLRHAEVLENGELGVRPLRSARATDNFTLAGSGTEEYAPTFTFHGFRFAEITGWPGEFDPGAVTAEVIHSDMRRTGWFDSSHELLNRLHENVVWGMRGNFLYLPTDCPQRDERMGWTGDIQIFGPTASFLYDCDGFLASWLEDVWHEQQAAGGGVAFVVPDVLRSGDVPAAAWGDVATVLPTVLHERFGDLGVVERQYPSMKAWTDLLLGLAGDRYLWEGGFQFGDWVDPDSPPENPAKAKTDPDIVASAFLYRSTDLLSRAAELLGDHEDADHYSALAEKVRQAWLAEYTTPAGRIVSDAQTAYALAIEFGIAEGELAAVLGRRLAELARRDGYRISTGFVGTPLVNDALTRTGHVEPAARMLLQTECPSWLYSVGMGATTVWERWDSLLPDGSINPGEMTSFNHYALGSVADWMHRVVAGLAPAEPGYKKVRIAPTPLPGLHHARARHEGPYGTIEAGWRREGSTVTVEATVPPNSTAVVELPDRAPFEVGSGTHIWQFEAPGTDSPATPITLLTTLADIIDDAEAHAELLAAWDRVDPVLGADFRARTRWIQSQTLSAAFSIVSPVVADKVMGQLEDFNASREA